VVRAMSMVTATVMSSSPPTPPTMAHLAQVKPHSTLAQMAPSCGL
jgi:hypothetical protein